MFKPNSQSKRVWSDALQVRGHVYVHDFSRTCMYRDRASGAGTECTRVRVCMARRTATSTPTTHPFLTHNNPHTPHPNN